MKEKEINLAYEDILRIASGRDSEGIPRSVGSLQLDKILSKTEVEPVKDIFLKDAVYKIYVSGGAAIITLDLPPEALGLYHKISKLCETWVEEIDQPSDEQLTLLIMPYTLAGQIILVFNQMMFVDSYKYQNDKHQTCYKIILGFDNEASYVIETDQIDYKSIQNEITLELKRYESQIDDEIQQAIEEEREAREQENLVDQQMQQFINKPLVEKNRQDNVEDTENIRFREDEEQFRFVEDKEEL